MIKIFVLILLTSQALAVPPPEPFSKTLQREKISKGIPRDTIIQKHIGPEITKMDETAKYIFYNVLLEYTMSDTLKKYPFLTKQKVLALRKDFLIENTI